MGEGGRPSEIRDRGKVVVSLSYLFVYKLPVTFAYTTDGLSLSRAPRAIMLSKYYLSVTCGDNKLVFLRRNVGLGFKSLILLFITHTNTRQITARKEGGYLNHA